MRCDPHVGSCARCCAPRAIDLGDASIWETLALLNALRDLEPPEVFLCRWFAQQYDPPPFKPQDPPCGD